MRFRRSITRESLARKFGSAALLAILVAFGVPAASLGCGATPGEGETSDQRSEFESTEHSRATLKQLRRSKRCKLNPTCSAGIFLGHDELRDRFQPIAATQHFEPLADGWTSPLRI
jgi:hypothetical protein